jgi:hypothetical protein
LSETVLHCINRQLITTEQLQDLDPTALITLPRIAIILGLLLMPGCIDLKGQKNTFSWFRDKVTLLDEIHAQLLTISLEQGSILEKQLAGVASTCSEESVLCSLFRSICIVADDLQSGPRSREFNCLLERVFSMYQ